MTDFIPYSLLKKICYFPEDRFVAPDYFSDDTIRDAYVKNGFAVVPQVASDEAVQLIRDSYIRLQKNQSYFKADGFITTPNYGIETQQSICDTLKQVNALVLPRIFDMQKIRYDFFSLLVIKFNKDKSFVTPHLDISMVDELQSTTTFLWIPTEDIDEKNGALLVLPGSHRWARWQKTHNRDITPIKKNAQWLIKEMIPVYVKKGDVVVFDASLIHGSMPNISAAERVAMNTSVISNQCPMVHYEINPDTPDGMVEKYAIDISFWEQAAYIQSVAGKGYSVSMEPLRRQKQLSKWNLRYLNKVYNPLLSK